ncbi:hypothetical protein GWO18_01135 [Candidatus Bathyarchaeota archaeon]|nr:hypothetical protein [Candidatus Bathyarchaeota archaeon]
MGVETAATFIIGMPGETKEEILQTIRFANELDPDYAQFSIATPYPGTELYEMANEDGLIKTQDWSRYTVMKPIIATKEFMAKDVGKLLSKAYRAFYLRPRFLLRQILKKRFSLFKLVFKSYILHRNRHLTL